MKQLCGYEINPAGVPQLAEIIALDVETDGLNSWRNHLRLIVIKSNDVVYIFDPVVVGADYLRRLMWAIRACKTVIIHNAKFDVGFLYAATGVLLENVWCTQMAAQIINNGRPLPDWRLPTIISHFVPGAFHAFANSKHELQLSFTAGGSLSQKQLDYAAEDVVYLIDVYKEQWKQVAEHQLHNVTRLENSLVPVLAKMEHEGIKIDVDKWRSLIVLWDAKVLETEQALDNELLNLSETHRVLKGSRFVRPRNRRQHVTYDLFGGSTTEIVENQEAANYGSSTQLVELFTLLNVKIPTNQEGNVSMDEESLSNYLTENSDSPLHKFIALLIEHRQYNKLCSTYGNSFLAKLDSRNYIHTEYTQTFTATGRLSSAKPNLQNIPGDEIGGLIRECFVPDDGDLMIDSDMSGAEVRIAASFSRDPLLVDAMVNGADMHSKLASVTFSIIFGQPVTIDSSKDYIEVGGRKYVKKNLRSDHKRGTFAKFYKAGPPRMYSVFAPYINAHHPPTARKRIAKRISDALDAEMPKLSAYLDGLIRQANQSLMLRGPKIGRIRYFKPDDYAACANFPKLTIQSRSACDNGENKLNGEIKPGELRETFKMAILSQASSAELEGAETTGVIGRLNNQIQRPAQCGTAFVFYTQKTQI